MRGLIAGGTVKKKGGNGGIQRENKRDMEGGRERGSAAGSTICSFQRSLLPTV